MSELYDLPEGWEWKSINELTIKTKNLKPKENAESQFTYIDIGSVDNSIFKITEPKSILGKDAPSRAKKEVSIDDIVYSMTRPNLKNIAIVELEYDNPIASTGFCILRVNSLVTNKYLFYYLLTRAFFQQIEYKVRGAQYPAVSDTDVKQSLVPLPPLQEQKRIVSKLDALFEKIDKAIALHQSNMDEADGFMGSVLNEVFGELEEKYNEVPLFEVANVNRGKSKHRPRNDKKLFGGDYPFIQTGDVRNANKHINSYSETYSEFGLSQSKLWKKGTICMIIAANIGDVAILQMDSCFPDSVVGIYSEQNSNDFLYYFLLTLKQHLESKATTTAQMNINLKVLKSIEVPLPPFNIQQKTVTYLDKVSEKTEKIKSIQTEKMVSLKALKASLLDKAFRGEF